MAFDLKEFETPPAWADEHPVAKIYWIPVGLIEANDYNPDVVAPPEMQLLELSIEKDGYTQPIVVWQREDEKFEVVDGFHRFRVGCRKKFSHLPCVVLNRDGHGRGERMASTIRHNRARGKHLVEDMSCDCPRHSCGVVTCSPPADAATWLFPTAGKSFHKTT